MKTFIQIYVLDKFMNSNNEKICWFNILIIGLSGLGLELQKILF